MGVDFQRPEHHRLLFDASFVNNPFHARRANSSALMLGKDKQLVEFEHPGSVGGREETNVIAMKLDNAEIMLGKSRIV